ncbi:DUF2080 family transposase-associated protein [Desulfosarcina ovata]|uniref:Uncharacterized protein n=2 Tax=Desulfosarcina ovata TaxID=83564 RepID=A0A5K8AA27_9BACT|nr:DUF2080 family transposase-associated protein [Desulfosarcina ovata]BBO81637.1 hypothetical protein DSCO28_22030 [Desulfosarcina ovata subsp. sediminis]BBO88870.1 hypothetical protein DSCOOX_20500 [Desulfosarcina ovata subsp. ovata]
MQVGGLTQRSITFGEMGSKIVPERKKRQVDDTSSQDTASAKVKFEVYGEEMLEKLVKSSGNSGRVYLPPDWVGRHVKIIRID